MVAARFETPVEYYCWCREPATQSLVRRFVGGAPPADGGRGEVRAASDGPRRRWRPAGGGRPPPAARGHRHSAGSGASRLRLGGERPGIRAADFAARAERRATAAARRPEPLLP